MDYMYLVSGILRMWTVLSLIAVVWTLDNGVECKNKKIIFWLCGPIVWGAAVLRTKHVENASKTELVLRMLAALVLSGSSILLIMIR